MVYSQTEVQTRIAPVWLGLEAEKNFGLVASAVVEDAEASFPESATSTPGSNHIYVHWPHHLRTVHYHLKWRKLLKIQHHNDAHSLWLALGVNKLSERLIAKYEQTSDISGSCGSLCSIFLPPFLVTQFRSLLYAIIRICLCRTQELCLSKHAQCMEVFSNTVLFGLVWLYSVLFPCKVFLHSKSCLTMNFTDSNNLWFAQW